VETAEILSDRSLGTARQRRTAPPHVDLGWSEWVRHSALCVGPLLLADVIAAVVAFSLAGWVSAASRPALVGEWVSLAVAFLIAALLCHAAVGMYPGVGLSLVAEARRATLSAGYLAGAFLIIGWGASRLPTSGLVFFACCLLAGLVPIARALARNGVGRFNWWAQPALILGGGDDAASLHAFLCRHHRLGLRPLGILCDEEANWQSDDALVNDLLRITVPQHQIPRLWFVLTRSERTPAQLGDAVRCVGGCDPRRTIIADQVASPGLWHRLDGRLEWFQQQHPWRTAPVEGAKRAVDVLLAGLGGLLGSPLLVIIALLIKWQAPGPVLYCQQRIGRDGRRFMVWKFRTMICDADRVLADFLADSPERRDEWERTHKLQDDPRITAIGHWLRKTSLDELPQLWNVLRGEMSLVGPRPIVEAEICKYEDRFAAYCSLLPGITGLWQVSGRSDTTYGERVELDSYYARHHSLWLDFYILLMTVKVVLFRQGAY
jgi:Undecaprenyl-phosphate galactose phosphotransferase WbaP